jgi:hypothetical protein
MRLRAALYIILGLALVIIIEIANTRLGWRIDIAWLFIAAAAFAYPPEIAAMAGVVYGVALDALSGNGALVYTLSYGGFGTALVMVRKGLYLRGFLAGWILAVFGAEALWLFLGMCARAIALMGGPARPPGWLSPFVVSVAVGYPVIYCVARLILAPPTEASMTGAYGVETRVTRA